MQWSKKSPRVKHYVSKEKHGVRFSGSAVAKMFRLFDIEELVRDYVKQRKFPCYILDIFIAKL